MVSVDGFHRKLLDLIVCPISSQPRYYRKPGPGDHPLKGWRSAGLRHPSTARISNILAVEKKLVKRVLGRLQADDILRIEQGLREAFGLLAAAARPALRDGKPSVQRGREVQIRGGASS